MGVLNIGHPQLNAFTVDDITLLEAIASQVVIAIENARLFEEKDQAIKQLREEQKKSAAAARLAAVNAVAGEFVHRMNNVAGTIPVRVEQIRELLRPEDPNYPRLSRYLDAISQDSEGILKAAQAVKSSEIDRDSVELIAVGTLVSTAIQRIALPSGKNIINRCGKQLPKVLAFSGQLIDTLENIIRNGLEAIEDSGIVTIRTRNIKQEAQEWVAIDIQDTGRGIPPEDLPKIFELFYSTKVGGMGFSLWRAKTLVESLGGTVTVSSVMGEGTTFTIVLPAARE